MTAEPHRRQFAFGSGLLYVIGGTVVWWQVGTNLGGAGAEGPTFVRELAAWALMLMVGLPTATAGCGLVGSAGGSRSSYLLVIVPAAAHLTLLLVAAPLLVHRPDLIGVAILAAVVSLAAAVTAPGLRPPALPGATR
jgi:hypothetical protein